MKKINFYFALFTLSILVLGSCKKESSTISVPQFQAGAAITGDVLSGSVKGTMQSGKTYYFASKATINENDTLVMQSGVKLLATNPAAELVVKGVFISLGTKENSNWITGEAPYLNPSAYKKTDLQDPNTDPALKPDGKFWGGIQCEATCPLLEIEWTHL